MGRLLGVICAIALVTVTGCTSTTGTVSSGVAGEPTAAPAENGPSALQNMDDPALPEPLVDLDDIVTLLPPDVIPAIDDPQFARAETVEWMQPEEALLALTVGGETRGYPLQIMTWHEIVNDTVGGVLVAVTYCPLCNSGVAFERRVGGRLLTFGTSGRLLNDNLVMYDRQTESLWPQLTGTASVGVLTGTRLTAIPIGIVAWADFVADHSDALVLTRDTGVRRHYGFNPYSGYDDTDGGLLVPLTDVDDRLELKRRVVGITVDRHSVAVVRDAVAGAAVLPVTVGGRDLVVWHRPGQASALDTDAVGYGKDVGTIGVFDPVVDGQGLHFVAQGDGFRDQETGSRWTVLGHATAGPLTGTELTPHTHLDTFWFAWVTTHPDTRIMRGR